MLSQVIPYWEMRADGRAQIGMEGGVTAFMSTITSKIDAKGRVSVPSVFRSAIAAQNGDVASPHGIFVYPSFTENAIEGGGQSLMNDIGAMVDRLDLFTEERDALATSLFADSHHLTLMSTVVCRFPKPCWPCKYRQILVFCRAGRKVSDLGS